MIGTEKKRLRLMRLAGAIVLSAYKALVYVLSFLGPVLLLDHLRHLPAAMLLVLAILGYGIAGSVFLLLLVLTKKCLIGPLEKTGVETIESNYAQKWFAAATIAGLAEQSPFRNMIFGLSPFGSWFYRGMGAKMPDSVLIGGRAWIFDPWFLEMGENASIGAGAFILGHLGHGREIVLGRVIIGEGAIVGGRSIIFPNVQIGSHAVVAAGALVVSGTIIPDGETWAGIPARRIGTPAAVTHPQETA